MGSGMIRRFDDLGRISVPRDIRRLLKIHENDPFCINYDEKKRTITLEPYYTWEEAFKKEIQGIVTVLRARMDKVTVNMYQGTSNLYNPLSGKHLEDEAHGKLGIIDKCMVSAYTSKKTEWDLEEGVVVIPVLDEAPSVHISGYLVGMWNGPSGPDVSYLNRFVFEAEALVALFRQSLKS